MVLPPGELKKATLYNTKDNSYYYILTNSLLFRDIMEIYRDPPPGVVVLPNPEDITRIYAVITGPFDTPYEGLAFVTPSLESIQCFQ